MPILELPKDHLLLHRFVEANNCLIFMSGALSQGLQLVGSPKGAQSLREARLQKSSQPEGSDKLSPKAIHKP